MDSKGVSVEVFVRNVSGGARDLGEKDFLQQRKLEFWNNYAGQQINAIFFFFQKK